MKKCQRIRLLGKLFPFRAWTYFFLRRHLLGCPDCLKNFASIDDARSATVAKNRIGRVRDFWPQFLSYLQKDHRQRSAPLRNHWRWAVMGAGLLALIIGGIIILSHFPQRTEEGLDSLIKLRISYVKFYEEPAQTYIFQSQDTNTTFVWVEKQNKGELP
ncbi:MAG: hypothetical protein WCC06_02050 [Candidatus Aminicenantales bacterium]